MSETEGEGEAETCGSDAICNGVKQDGEREQEGKHVGDLDLTLDLSLAPLPKRYNISFALSDINEKQNKKARAIKLLRDQGKWKKIIQHLSYFNRLEWPTCDKRKSAP